METSRRHYSQEFKDELCQEVISCSRPVGAVATAYGVNPETLRGWVYKYRQAHGGGEEERPCLRVPGSKSWNERTESCARSVNS